MHRNYKQDEQVIKIIIPQCKLLTIKKLLIVKNTLVLSFIIKIKKSNLILRNYSTHQKSTRC